MVLLSNPFRSWQALVKMDDLAGILAGLQQRKARSQPFVRLLAAGLCSNPKTTANSQALIALLQKADLGDTSILGPMSLGGRGDLC